MDDLHAAIAAHLRAQRRPPPRAPRAFTCRDCGRLVREDGPASAVPFAALWVPLRCPDCFSDALLREPDEPIFGLWRDRCGTPRRSGRAAADDAIAERDEPSSGAFTG